MFLKQEAIGHHVRLLRKKAGLSVRALGARTVFSASFISQLENGLVSPSIGSMQKIAAALGVTLGEFFTAASGGASGTIVRARGRNRFRSHWSSAEIEAAGSGPRLESVLVHLAPGGRSGKHPYGHETAVCFLPGELRLWENPGRATTRLLFVTLRRH